jgi:hypothetical protein
VDFGLHPVTESLRQTITQSNRHAPHFFRLVDADRAALASKAARMENSL